jgi:hypothetical protein
MDQGESEELPPETEACQAQLLGGSTMSTETHADNEVLGIDTDGCLILWDADKRQRYNCGETLEQWGKENLTSQEISRLIRESYSDAECPDCGDPIPEDVVDGQECKNCGHTFCIPQSND